MRPEINRAIVSAVIRPFGLMGIFLLCCFSPVEAESYRGAIVCRAEVPTARRDDLAHKLQVITGWRVLTFDSNGTLHHSADFGDTGSSLARSLITRAFATENVLILEDASNRADVVFARVVPGRWQNNAGERRNAFVVLIDFADFDRLMGDRPALAAFNVGWSLLHEIDHVVNDSVDADLAGHAGECEDHINLMRRECHLPARLDYFYNFFPSSEQSDFQTRLVRLAFEQDDPLAKKRRRFWVIWDATQVGGLDSAKQVAALK